MILFSIVFIDILDVVHQQRGSEPDIGWGEFLRWMWRRVLGSSLMRRPESDNVCVCVPQTNGI